MSNVEPMVQNIPQPSVDELKQAYRVAARSRALEEHIVRLASRGEVKFAIWGPGEEVHGTATALALSKAVNPDHFGIVPHYRSGSLCSMWCELNGLMDFSAQVLRQQFSKDSDTMTRGRQMVYHLELMEVGILPVQSPVGMQLGKAAGYAKGFHAKDIRDAVTIGIVGDGTTAEGDMHDTMNAISVWQLPTIVMVTDNNVAISTTPEAGRGIKSFEKYAESFGVRFFTCDGRDFWDVYNTTYEAASYAREEQAPVLMHVRDLPRFNGHSSAADMTFDLNQADPLIAFAETLVKDGVLAEDDVLRRVEGEGRDFFSHHELGHVMGTENEEISLLMEQIQAEPDPPADSVTDHVHPPYPTVNEAPWSSQTTNITYGAAIRAALTHIIEHKNGVMWGQDVADLGGVFQASAGILERFPNRISDSPLNEPLIMGTATGAGLHEDLIALPEVQFGDYALNTFHWMVHLGNLYWTSNGRVPCSVIMRTPTDPFGGGAVYHSMSIDGYLTPIPGLTIVMPSTSWDVYGLLMTAADFGGPVVCLEPKWMYRQTLGPAFPGEPQDKEGISQMKKAIMRGDIPEIPMDLRVPFGKAATRRQGSDVTIVAWGRAVYTALKAADALKQDGVDAEVMDLRTLVPPDLPGVFESVGRTGRLVVAAEDRAFAGFARTIQGAVVEKFPGMPTRAVGQKNLPGIAQSPVLEAAQILTEGDIQQAVAEVLQTQVSGGPAGWSWIPPRYFLS